MHKTIFLIILFPPYVRVMDLVKNILGTTILLKVVRARPQVNSILYQKNIKVTPDRIILVMKLIIV